MGWIDFSKTARWRPKLEARQIFGLPLLATVLPAGNTGRHLRQIQSLFQKYRVRRALAPPCFDGWSVLHAAGISSVDPLPLCRAKGDAFLLTLINQVPLGERCVALRGCAADALAWTLADALCPHVKTLLLDFDRGELQLALHLRETYGAAPLHVGQGPQPCASLELAPRPNDTTGILLRLWGNMELAGLTLQAPSLCLPEAIEPLPLMELLWETGRASLDAFTVCPLPT